MKKILITGEKSYIGQAVEAWLLKDDSKYQVDTISVRGDEWKSYDFSIYDVVFNVAGIAHNSSDPELEDLYYSVNRDLAIEVAKHAKEHGVTQFIHMSSIIVYGSNVPEGKITPSTKPNPDNFYGDSKLQAEIGLEKLRDSEFKVGLIRPPMIYGKGSKGNYPLLSKLAKKTPIFPDFKNQRSMLHIDNLCSFIQAVIDESGDGYFYPQNKELVCTSQMVKEIANVYGRKIWMTKLFNPIIHLVKGIGIFKKVFGDLYYSSEIDSGVERTYIVADFKETIKRTEL